ncbi:MAG: trypsin-like peptidase domain-containing protein [Lachnospiraceae bacterium]|nr:trypsin-like peptidase domain-containing protein [Lachnospiraceae bacterium]
MYDKYDFGSDSYYNRTDNTASGATGTQDAAPKKAPKKKYSFFRKIGTSMCCAAVFGLVASGIFYGTTTALGAYGTVTESTAEADSASAEAKAPAALMDGSAKTADDGAAENQDAAQAKAEGTHLLHTDGSANAMSVADVADTVMPSMVAITNTSIEKVQNYFFYGYGQPQSHESVSKGSGIIIGQTDEELLVATNAHVVNDAETLTVTFNDDSSAEGYVKGSDTKNDLAVVGVKLSDISEETLAVIRVITIGDSDGIRIGEQVVAIGNALGYGQSVSSGYLSAKDRVIDTENGETEGLLQTDAAINPGNSGGALLNMAGELIGINSAKYAETRVEGMGFAIPVNYAIPILEKMMNAEVRTPVDEANASYLGIRGVAITEEASKYYGMPQGIYLQEVVEGSPAEKAGLIKGDVITAIGEVDVDSQEALASEMQYYAAGDEAVLTVYRTNEKGEYTERTITVTLGTRPAEQ